MEIYPDRYCVYLHKVKNQVRPLYVGKGDSGRPFSSRGRSQDWRKHVDQNSGIIDVLVLGWFETEAEALVFEKDQIKNLNPICNKVHNGWEYPAEYRERISAKLKGRPSPSRGVPHSLETRIKIGLANKGRIVSPATRQKIKASGLAWYEKHGPRASGFKGRHHSVEAKAKLRNANLGRGGRRYTEKTNPILSGLL